MKSNLLSILTIICLAFVTLILLEDVYGNIGHGIDKENFSGSTRYGMDRDYQFFPDSICLVFAGDVMGHETQLKGAWRDGGDSCYNFMPTFQWVKDYPCCPVKIE